MRAIAVLAFVLLLVCCDPQQRQSAQRPNILLVLTDDQRFDMLGSVHPFLETPNMDLLASQGFRFENAYVTTPICAASRASILTGVVERTHRYTFGTPPLSAEFVDLSYPTLLREAGYQTGAIGKFGVNTEQGAVEQMFDTFVPFVAHPYHREQADGSSRHLTDITADSAIEFLRSAAVDPSSPFALTVSFNAPHADDGEEQQYFWPEALDELYSDVPMPDPPLSEPSFFYALPGFLKDASLNRVRWYWRFDTPLKAQEMTRGYLRMISGIDAALGRILGELESLDVAENTVVILMSDNGYFLGERGYAGKWLPYDLSIRVPLIVYDPRAPDRLRGATPSLPALNIDIAPTLLDLAGIEIPTSIQGRSLAPILYGETPADWRTDFFVEHLFDHLEIPKHEGVRGERFKYARYFEQVPVYEELYDLLADPLEARNLAGDPGYLEILSQLRNRTDELEAEYESSR